MGNSVPRVSGGLSPATEVADRQLSTGRDEPAIVFTKLAADVLVPERQTDESAGYDLQAHLTRGSVKLFRRGDHRARTVNVVAERGAPPSIELHPGDRALIPTGLCAKLPNGFEGQIRMRSSLAWKYGLTVPNAPGTIDADYPDEWFVLVCNSGTLPIRIEHGMRIAHVVVSRYEAMEWREGDVEVSTDRRGGLGSTGD